MRVVPVTSCPASIKRGTTNRPIAPVAPATKTFIVLTCATLGRDIPHRMVQSASETVGHFLAFRPKLSKLARMSQERARRENDLIAYYDNEVQARAGRDLPDARVSRRTAYLRRLHQEERRTVLEIGCGPGRDGQAIAAAGFSYVGVDLAPASVEVCRGLGLDARVGSVLDLPFEDASFDAGWTMSTLLHVADEDLDQAMSEIVRVLRPGAPLAVGLWGSATSGERVWQDDRGFGPGRFFSTRTDDGLRATLERYGDVDEWETWNDDSDGPMHYQWAVVTVSGDPGPPRR